MPDRRTGRRRGDAPCSWPSDASGYGLGVPPGDAFLRACRMEPVPHTPVWFMRQAGRSLPEYRALRADGNILDAIARPELAVELTLQPVRRYGVDAAILFSDIVVPLVALGVGIDIVPGRGPVLERPFRHDDDLDAAAANRARGRPRPRPRDRRDPRRASLKCPLSASPARPSRSPATSSKAGRRATFGLTKRLMHAEPATWHRLVDRLAGICLASLRAQVEAGAAAVQLFDSWAGALSPGEYAEFALPASRRILERPRRPRCPPHPLRRRHRASCSA